MIKVNIQPLRGSTEKPPVKNKTYDLYFSDSEWNVKKIGVCYHSGNKWNYHSSSLDVVEYLYPSEFERLCYELPDKELPEGHSIGEVLDY